MHDLLRKGWAEIDLDAIRDNASTLARIAEPAELCVAVKANGYGHGMFEVARAGLDGGASRLAVATTEEGIALREAGFEVPILVLAEPHPDAMRAVVENGLTPAVYSQRAVAALATFASPDDPTPVHVKADTGMHRAGAPLEDVIPLMQEIAQHAGLYLEGLFTHFAVADEPKHPLTQLQAERFGELLKHVADAGFNPPIIHCANSAATLLHPDLHFSMVRCGIAFYGLLPSTEVALPAPMRPALSIKAQVAFVRRVPAGDGVSYGQKYILAKDATIATIPLGYGDGIPRPLGMAGGEVLINGKRYSMAGNISMDQFMVDCGDDVVQVDDEVVIVGTQGNETIYAHEVAEKLGTINYEITTRLLQRLARTYVGAVQQQ